MKILLAHNIYQYAGGEDVAFETDARLLADRGHDVVRYTRSNDEIDGYSPAEKVALAARTVWSGESARRLSELIARERPDVAHFHNTFPLISPSAYQVCRRAGIPVVQTLHNFRLICLNALLFRDGRICEDCVGRTPLPGVLHACYRDSRAQSGVVATMLAVHRALRTWERRVDVILAVSEFAKRKLVEGGLPADRISVRPGAPYPAPAARAPETTGDYFLYVGRLSQEKGLDTLLAAISITPAIALKLAGDGPLEAQIREGIARGEPAGVEMLGRVSSDEVRALMRGARALVFPSRVYETFGLVVVEAMASGTPVIASALGPLADLVVDGITGLRAAPGDAADWTAKLRRAWDHPEEMAEMGRNARAAFERSFSADRSYVQLMDAYALASERAAGPG